jgi:predicted Zn-dependent protease
LRLERFREVFRRLSGLENFDSSVPTRIIVFKSDEFFRDYKPVNREGKLTDWAEGYFAGGENVNYIALSVKGDREMTYRTIFHEYIHFLIDNDIGRSKAPPWLNEGLAEFYELLQIEDERRATVGAANQAHLHLLRQNKLIPFETFFNYTYHTLNLQSKDTAQLFYAQAWALIHYLLQGNDGAKKERFDKFIEAVKSGRHSKEAFREFFQSDFQQLERELTAHINQKNFRTTAAIFKDSFKFEEQIETSSIAEAEAKAVLGDLLFHTGRIDAAAAHLEEAVKLDENSAFAHIALGLVRLRQKNFAEAKKHLEKAVKLDEKNYLAHYQLAYVLSREEMSEFGFVSGYDFQRAEKMREALRRAITLNPNFAQSYNLYAFINIVRNEEIEQAAEYMKKAAALAPGNQWYQIRSAEILMRKEDFANARQIAQKIFQTAPDEELRIYALNRINLINSLEKQLESLKNYNERLKNEIPDKILTDEEFARLREQAILESINQGLRRPLNDEIRVLGYLIKVECRADGVEYFVKVGEKILKLASKNFENLILVSFAREMNNVQLGCESIKNETFAVVTYQPSKNALRTEGEVLSIEFVPQNFKFLN